MILEPANVFGAWTEACAGAQVLLTRIYGEDLAWLMLTGGLFARYPCPCRRCLSRRRVPRARA